MSVRCKFRCVEKKEMAYYGDVNKKTSEAVVFSAVSDDANKEWAKYTPSGRLEMTIDNPAALDQFVVGECYYIDITKAE